METCVVKREFKCKKKRPNRFAPVNIKFISSTHTALPDKKILVKASKHPRTTPLIQKEKKNQTLLHFGRKILSNGEIFIILLILNHETLLIGQM